MTATHVMIHGMEIEVIAIDTIVVGTGASGFNAADRLFDYGHKDFAIVTENINAGTSRNTGSDKQTYYKLSLSGEEQDSVMELAKTLFSGQCTDGDICLAEASLSAPSFIKLCDLGVPFPVNRYGGYVGYKTDHDPRKRGTSVGPLTSKMMTEALERSVISKQIKIFDKHQVISILTEEGKITGLLCLNYTEAGKKYVAFHCSNVIYATGGPAAIYSDSVFPLGHYGASGLAFQAGVKGKNLTEWQYGIASTKPRWNCSGTYMQVLPRFISTDNDGGDEKEFLLDFFEDKGKMLTGIFLKGYEWPFDVRKVEKGSSIIDILVYIETHLKGRRVYLDFTKNPMADSFDFGLLSDEAKSYLENATAAFGTPIERLIHMNEPAYDFYASKGVDLKTTPLEIKLCAQHNNGGLSIDSWWQTNIQGFFAVGEAAGSHGVYRPGGSALNSGQVGSTRAAQFVAFHKKETAVDVDRFVQENIEAIADTIGRAEKTFADTDNVKELTEKAQKRMSKCGSAIRDMKLIEKAIREIKFELDNFSNIVTINHAKHLPNVYRLYDILTAQYVYLSAIVNYGAEWGRSRGSALYSNGDGLKPYKALPDIFSYILDDGSRADLIQEVLYENGRCTFNQRKARPIPEVEDFFENVWKQYRENKNVY